MVTSVPAAGVLTECVLGSHRAGAGYKDVLFQNYLLTFNLSDLLFSVLTQTNSSWKAAKVGPRSLGTVTVFSAGRVGT